MYFCILRFICIQNYKNASHSCRKSRKNCTNTAVFTITLRICRVCPVLHGLWWVKPFAAATGRRAVVRTCATVTLKKGHSVCREQLSPQKIFETTK